MSYTALESAGVVVEQDRSVDVAGGMEGGTPGARTPDGAQGENGKTEAASGRVARRAILARATGCGRCRLLGVPRPFGVFRSSARRRPRTPAARGPRFPPRPRLA